jgi:hypothetical protein
VLILVKKVRFEYFFVFPSLHHSNTPVLQKTVDPAGSGIAMAL